MNNKVSLLQGVISFVLFFSIGYLSLIILKTDISLQILMQIFYLLVLVLGISFKIILPKLSANKKHYFLIFATLPIVAFIYLLFFSTGILFSPYLILTHFFTIAVSFLLTPVIAVSFILSTISLIIGNAFFEGSLQSIFNQNSFFGILIGISYIGLIPLSFILSKEYKFKEEWSKILEQQIVTTKNQEEDLLQRLDEIVIVIDKKFNILYLNITAQKTFKLDSTVIKKDIYKFLKFKNQDGIDLYSYSLPFFQTLKSKQPQTINNIQIKGSNNNFSFYNLKLIPALDKNDSIGLILLIQNKSDKKNNITSQSDFSTIALTKFLQQINLQKNKILETSPKSHLLLEQNKTLTLMAEDLMYVMRLDSGNIGSITTIFDISLLIDKLILEENSNLNSNGIILYPIIPNNKIGLLMPPERKIEPKFIERQFQDIFIIGNEEIIKHSIKRILKLLYLTSVNRSSISVNIYKSNDLAVINLICHKNIIESRNVHDLFEKYYGSLSEMNELRNGSGLEGYIAKTLLERMGANIKIRSSLKDTSLTISITFGINKINSKASSQN